MKSFKAVIALALSVYVLLVVFFIALLKMLPPSYNKGNVVIKGNNNTVVFFDNPWNDDYPERCAGRIFGARKSCGDDKFDIDDASYLVGKIMTYADKYGIPYLDAFVIVNVESDFKKTAYNKKGGAYGLCQITAPCLAEYNNINGTDYDIEAVMDIDINLDVGFWYYKRLMEHYSAFPDYGITTTNNRGMLRDCYIAYNIGVTKFRNLGSHGRNSMRNGVYPESMYGNNKGDLYKPIIRFYQIYDYWLDKK